MEHLPQIFNAKTSNGYDFSSQFKFVKDILNAYDIAIANLETTFSDTISGYPHFSAPDTLAYFLKQAGFDVLCIANNHIGDFRTSGIKRTIKTVEKAGLFRTGAFLNNADKQSHNPIIFRKGNLKVALLNYTYGINEGYFPNVNIIDTNMIKKDIEKAQKLADAIIIFFHWGEEYSMEPTEQQKAVAQCCFKNGVNVVVGTHPHVIQPAKFFTINGKRVLLAYSVGNFVSNYYRTNSDGGLMLAFQIIKNKDSVFISNPHFYPVWVYKKLTPAKKIYYVLPAYMFDSSFVTENFQKKRFGTFLKNTRSFLKENSNIKVSDKPNHIKP